MRIALFGGTFDPLHRGHLAIATAAADRFQLDQVLFAPVGRQPLKRQHASASFADRVAMVQLACAELREPRFLVSTLDAPRPDGSPNYTVDTLVSLSAAWPGASLFNLIGADNFRNIAGWKQPGKLLALAEWIVISRPGFPLDPPPGLALSAAQQNRIHLLDAVHDDTSATALRARLTSGEPCTDLIPASVRRYIELHHLYSVNASDQRGTGGSAG